MKFYRFAVLVFCVLMDVFLTSDGEKDDPAKCEICGIAAQVKKVMNGTEAAIGKYPWIVALKKKGENTFCTGSLISSKYILTAAHCLINIKGEDLVIGLQDKEGLKPVEVKRIIPHSSYSNKTNNNDIALVELTEGVQCDQTPKPLCLPQKDLSNVGQDLIIAGYGFSRPGKTNLQNLMEGVVKQVPISECYGGELDTENILCARGDTTYQSSCQGDSGAAIFKRENTIFYGVGITSIGPGDCTSDGNGDQHTNVYKYMSWIKEYVRNLPEPKKKMK